MHTKRSLAVSNLLYFRERESVYSHWEGYLAVWMLVTGDTLYKITYRYTEAYFIHVNDLIHHRQTTAFCRL